MNYFKNKKKNKQLSKILTQQLKLTLNKPNPIKYSNIYDIVIQISSYRKNTFISCFNINGELLYKTSEGMLDVKRKDRLSPYSGRLLGENINFYFYNKLIFNHYKASNVIIVIKNYSSVVLALLRKLELFFFIKKIILHPTYSFNGCRKKKARRI